MEAALSDPCGVSLTDLKYKLWIVRDTDLFGDLCCSVSVWWKRPRQWDVGTSKTWLDHDGRLKGYTASMTLQEAQKEFGTYPDDHNQVILVNRIARSEDELRKVQEF